MPWVNRPSEATPGEVVRKVAVNTYGHNNGKTPQSPQNHVRVNIAGVATVLNTQAATFRRIVWGTTLLVCLVTLIGILGERFAYFLSFPVIVDVQVIHNSSLKFPAITTCPSTRGNNMGFSMDPRATREVYEKMLGPYPGFLKARGALERSLDAKQLWDSTAWNISSMVDKCYQGRGQHCNEVGQFHLSYTMLGPCLTYIGKPATLAGSYHGLYLRLSHENRTTEDESKYDLTGWWVVVHEAEDDPSLLIKTHGYYVGFKWNKEISVSLKHFESLDTRRKPCKGDAAYRSSQCITQCFSRSFIKLLRCRLPFMAGDVPYCRGVRMLERVNKHLEQMLLLGQWKPSRCNCEIPCIQTIYEYRGDTTDDRTDENGRIKVFYLDLMYERVKEEFSYPFASLVADFGGMMGLLLGASLLTLIEAIEAGSDYLLRLYRSHKAEESRSYTYTEVSVIDTGKIFSEVYFPRPPVTATSRRGPNVVGEDMKNLDNSNKNTINDQKPKEAKY